MKKILLRIFLFGLLLFDLYAAYKFYGKHLEDKRRATFGIFQKSKKVDDSLK